MRRLKRLSFGNIGVWPVAFFAQAGFLIAMEISGVSLNHHFWTSEHGAQHFDTRSLVRLVAGNEAADG
jgi:hypothetical protein